VPKIEIIIIFTLLITFSIIIPNWGSWLRHCTESRMVAGSIPGGVIGILHRHNPSGRTVVFG